MRRSSLWFRVDRQWIGGGRDRLRGLPGELLLWRDAAASPRLCFLAVADDLGLLGALRAGPASATDLAGELGVVNTELFEAFLALGAQLGQLRCVDRRWRLHGARARAAPAAEALRGMLAEARRYDAPAYQHLVGHCEERHPASTSTASEP